MSVNPIIEEAFFFSKDAHGDTLDDSGKNYFDAHIVPVATIVSQFTYQDAEAICAALLHDTVEDTDITEDQIREKFGDRITKIVMMVTHEGTNDHTGYYFPRFTQEYAGSEELYTKAVIVKYVDRLSNISRMRCWDEDRRLHYLKKSQFWKTE